MPLGDKRVKLVLHNATDIEITISANRFLFTQPFRQLIQNIKLKE